MLRYARFLLRPLPVRNQAFLKTRTMATANTPAFVRINLCHHTGSLLNPTLEQGSVRTAVPGRPRCPKHHRQGNLEAVFWTRAHRLRGSPFLFYLQIMFLTT